MDCCICSSMPFILRPPRNSICGACYEGARALITLLNKLEADKPITNIIPSPNSTKPQPLANVTKWMNYMKEEEEELNKKISFLSGFLVAFRQQVHTDILLVPGNNGQPVPAHRALLAARSEIFKNILESDGCKAAAAAAAGDIINLPELNQEELESLLEFLYSGTLPSDKAQKHVYPLFVAADKYDIPYLQEFCERQMLASLSSSNVLDILEISDLCSNKTLKETALNFIVRNVDDVVFSPMYESFAPKNPHLCVQITRAFLMDSKNRSRPPNNGV